VLGVALGLTVTGILSLVGRSALDKTSVATAVNAVTHHMAGRRRGRGGR
jgi:hypothetical protein